jgi:dolichyl-phosphate beta-glucosyltransferase
VVVPCFNEEKRLDCDSFRAFASKRPECGFLFVNDGSTDRTAEVLNSIVSSDSDSFAVYELACNSGKAEAVRQGILKGLESCPAYIGMWDADLATPLEVIAQFTEILDMRPEVNVITGARVKLLGRNIEREGLRHYLGRLSATLISLALGVAVYDTQCGAKLFRVTKHLETVFQEPFASKWIFDVEIISRLIAAHRCGLTGAPEEIIWEVPLDTWEHKGGSKIKAGDYLTALYDLLKIRQKYFGKNIKIK